MFTPIKYYTGSKFQLGFPVLIKLFYQSTPFQFVSLSFEDIDIFEVAHYMLPHTNLLLTFKHLGLKLNLHKTPLAKTAYIYHSNYAFFFC